MTHINHITFLTGHNRKSPKSEVSQSTITWLTPWVKRGLQTSEVLPLPAPDLASYGARFFTDADFLFVTLYSKTQSPMLSFGVAINDAHAGALWEQLLSISEPNQVNPKLAMPEPPYLAVTMNMSEIEVDRSVLTWAGDFERCVAWTWLSLGERNQRGFVF